MKKPLNEQVGFREMKRDELSRAVQVEWGEYLPVLRALTAEQQTAYARQEGFHSLRDFLIHVAAWWSKAIEFAAVYQYGNVFPPYGETDHEFDARTLERYANWTLEDAEKYFTIAWLALCGMVNGLPDKCFQNPVIHRWLYETIIQHYQQHESPAIFRKRLAA